MSRHGDPELTRLNYVLWPDESIGPHTRVDIANEAASTIDSLKRQLADAKRNEERAVARAAELDDWRIAEYRDTQKREAETEADTEATEMRLELKMIALKTKLHTLEAAIRSVRDEGCDIETGEALSSLFALVPVGVAWTGMMPEDAPDEISFVLDLGEGSES